MTHDPDEILKKCPKCHQEDLTSFSTCRYCSSPYVVHDYSQPQSLLEKIMEAPVQTVIGVFVVVSIFCSIYVSQSLNGGDGEPRMVWGAHGEVPSIPAAIITFFGQKVLGKASETIETQTKVLEKNPADYEALVSRGDAYWTEGMMSQAFVDYSSAINANPNIPAAYEKRAIIFDAKGEYDHAKKDRDTAADLRAH